MNARSAEPRPEKAPAAQDKYEAILTAALHVFAERGFHGAAVPDVARRAGVAAGTIYTYFPGKEALVNTLYRKWKSVLARAVYTRFPADAPPREQFDAMWGAMAELALANPEAFTFLELHHHRSYLDAESRALENQVKDFAAVAVSRGQAMGVFRKMDTTVLLELLFGAFVGMIRAHQEGRVKLTDETIEAARGACWDLVRAPETHAKQARAARGR